MTTIGLLLTVLASPLTAQNVYTVNSTGDGSDTNPGDAVCDDGAGNCTLRAAIEESNAIAGTTDSISFAIAGTGPHTIQPGSDLPAATDPVVIDGYTQSGASPNTNGPLAGTNAVLMIVIDMSSGTNGVELAGGHSTVRGLVVHGAPGLGSLRPEAQILLTSDSNLVEGNFLGTDAGGTTAVAGITGVMTSSAVDNVIGGTNPASVNLIHATLGTSIVSVTTGSGHVVQGNIVGLDAAGTTPLGGTPGIGIQVGGVGVIVGGAAPGAGNTVSGVSDGISIFSNTGSVVQGNLIGTDVTGTVSIGNGGHGIEVGGTASSNLIGGAVPGARNVIAASTGLGINLAPFFGGGPVGQNVVQGNYIGTDITGAVAFPNVAGIEVNHLQIAVIGGTAPGEGNLISGNTGTGLFIRDSDSAVIQGNLIGTEVTGALPLPNGGAGLTIDGSSLAMVGGTAVGAANTIAFNGAEGILVTGTSTGNAIRTNRIHSNGGLGIDLGADGVTANDASDGDSGPNNRQNFPDLTGAWVSPSGIRGVYQGAPSQTLTLDFFASGTCDVTGNGEGAIYLASSVVNTTPTGSASFSATPSTPLSVGDAVTTTATDTGNNTSEFSACVTVTAADTLLVTSADDVDDGSCNMTHCSLREAINEANSRIGPDSIQFAIPAPGPHLVEPLTDLPVITDDVVIDGYTQPGASPNTNPLSMGSNAVIMIELSRTMTLPVILTGLDIAADNVTIRGLAISGFLQSVSMGGRNNVLVGSLFGTDVTGTAAASIVGQVIDQASGPVRIGGPSPADRNVIVGNLSLQSDSSVVQGNFIGVDVSGQQPLGATLARVLANQSNFLEIGGAGPGEGNVIAGGIGTAIGASDMVIQGNYIGTDATGTVDLGNPRPGIRIVGARNLIGGVVTGAANRIAFNDSAGIVVAGLNDNSILGNEIHSNGGLGIDLAGAGAAGVTANDAGDGDTGANNLQNYPVLSGAFVGSTILEGNLNSSASTDFRLEFFSNPTCHPSGHGEGTRFLGAASVTTDGAGDVTFVETLADTATPGQFVTATATDPAGNTSEFSQCVTASGFATSVTPIAATVPRGTGASYDVTVSALGATFDRNVVLSCSGVPTGAACGFSPTTLNPGIDTAMAVLTVTTTDSTTPTGVQAFDVVGSYLSIQDTVASNLTVTDFSVAAAPTSSTTLRGGNATWTITVSPQGPQFDDVVTLACANLPAQASCSFSSASVTPADTGATSTLTVSTSDPDTPAGLSSFEVTGSSGALTRSTQADLIVTDFMIAVDPDTVETRRGESAEYTVAVNPDGGSFTQPIMLDCAGLPAETACVFAPTAVTPDLDTVTSILTLSSTTSAALGAQTFTVEGTSSTLQGVATATVDVVDFLMTLSLDSVALPSGNAQVITVTVGPEGDSFGHAVSLSCTNATLVTCAFSPATLTPGLNDATSALTISPAASAVARSGSAAARPFGAGRGRWAWVLLSLAAIALAMVHRVPLGRRHGLAAAAIAGLLVAGCKPGEEIVEPPPPPPPPQTETISVEATSGTLTRTASLTVTVGGA